MKKLLIITQAVDVNDPILGFFHRWIEEFAKHCQRVTVICLKEGEHHLPANVHVLSLGKELRSRGRTVLEEERSDGKRSVLAERPRLFNRIQYSIRFYRYIWRERKSYDSVFVHMNPEYILLGGALWRLWGKRIGLWYTHKRVDLKLRLAALLTHVIFTASAESFRLASKKLHVMGHGIDTTLFSCPTRTPREASTPLSIITIGRITESKHILEMLKSLEVLHARGVSFSCAIVGAPAMASDHEYEHNVRAYAALLPFAGQVVFAGAKTQGDIVPMLCNADVFLNLSTTGSLDKAVLEAMSAGVVPVSSNEAFKDILEPRGLYVPLSDSNAIADALARAPKTDPQTFIAYVAANHSLTTLIPRILELL